MVIQNKNILITGATGGIGRHIAHKLAELGNNIVLCGRDIEKLTNLEISLANKNNNKHYKLVMDLSDITGIKAKVSETVKMLGKIDIFIHCAGVAPLKPLNLINYNSMLETFNINLFSFIEIAKAFAQQKFTKEDYGNIVVISSVITKLCEKGRLEYSASKQALENAVKIIAKELISKNIRVNGIRPAFVDTDMTLDYLETINLQDEVEKVQPLGIINPNEITLLLLLLLLSNTGTIFDVNGGMVI